MVLPTGASSNTDRGISIYGVYLKDSSNYQFIRTKISTGNAGIGADGVRGQNGLPGNSKSEDTKYKRINEEI